MPVKSTRSQFIIMPTQTESSISSFLDFTLDERLYQAIAKESFSVPKAVQALTIPAALAGKDCWVCAKTGSGKTAAFIIPAIQSILNLPTPKATRVMILVPTRELARQVLKQCRHLSAFTEVQSGMIIGGEDFKKQSNLFKNNVEVIIATPGRLLEHIEEGSPNFTQLTTLVMDEADRMLEMGLRQDILKITEHLNPNRQTLFFSATLNPTVSFVASKLLNNPEKIVLDGIHEKHGQIEQQFILADDFDHKQQLLHWLLLNETYAKALVFTNTKLQAEKLRGPIRGQKLTAGLLHGDLDQKERRRVMELYEQDSISILVATDVAARGLDIEGVDLVINFDLARNATDYIHRIGRTGRAEKQGLAIALINAMEWNQLAGIERYMRQRLTRRIIKSIEGHYKGPKKLKSSGKAAGKKSNLKDKKIAAEKIKNRHRDRKNIGKRRQPSASDTASNEKNQSE